ncbi:alpha-galactosidase [Lunatibacter salilacus]|uniref:alpha-galactosidase n=1 Tax=Lunatibacter salilacus TaxID=2483804 RepID=UPI00131C2883|nr:alpha-galactosidase [Lunatibacter salilacus]
MLWNKGNFIPHAIADGNGNHPVTFVGNEPAFDLVNAPFRENRDIQINFMKQSIHAPAHLRVKVLNEHDASVKVLRVFKIFPETSAITMEIFLQYGVLAQQADTEKVKLDGTESFFKQSPEDKDPYLQHFGLAFPHWKHKVIRFRDVTDRNDNLVDEQTIMPYGAGRQLQGNLLLSRDVINEVGFFLLKEGPNGDSQINYPGYDYSLSKTNITVPFSGFPFNARDGEWVKGYPLTIGRSERGTPVEWALREYLKNSVNYDPEMYEMVMMNTWGDRGQDGKISEEFVLKELDVARELGVSHYQLDDGWQQGLSKNSASSEGKLWERWLPEDWEPHTIRFPNGLDKVVEKANSFDIRLGLWFNPSMANDFAAWEDDAKIIVDLHNSTGIQYFKIDGVQIPTKAAEVNLHRFFDKVKMETDNKVFFNLDLTAGIRGGYFLTRYAGNLFLENRYTDWGNYYPYRTLRNVWMLSKYFPPEFLQVEFLNKWRNTDKYPAKDPFAPSQYDFEYVFATAMAGQPLAWFEATGLPEEALEIGETVRKYKEHQEDFHSGFIFPIGEEPTGSSWTGFHSVNPDRQEGYVLVFREKNERQSAKFSLPSLQEGTFTFTHVLGGGKDFTAVVGYNEEVEFSLPSPNSYQLMKYKLVRP